jgi:hypothetical protein
MNRQSAAASDAAECVARLDELVTKCVSFLQGQMQRLDQEYQDLDGLQSTPSEDGRAFEDLSEQQAAWERRQAEEESRINEQLECLTQAWNLLEDEQRRQMTEGPAPHTAGALQPTPFDNAQANTASTGVDLIDAPCDLSSSAAEIQFQKLKREIRQHTRRNR